MKINLVFFCLLFSLTSRADHTLGDAMLNISELADHISKVQSQFSWRCEVSTSYQMVPFGMQSSQDTKGVWRQRANCFRTKDNMTLTEAEQLCWHTVGCHDAKSLIKKANELDGFVDATYNYDKNEFIYLEIYSLENPSVPLEIIFP